VGGVVIRGRRGAGTVSRPRYGGSGDARAFRSTIEASWINITLFDRARRRLRVRSVETLSVEHEAVAAAARQVGLA
jgi:hypothetical protein